MTRINFTSNQQLYNNQKNQLQAHSFKSSALAKDLFTSSQAKQVPFNGLSNWMDEDYIPSEKSILKMSAMEGPEASKLLDRLVKNQEITKITEKTIEYYDKYRSYNEIAQTPNSDWPLFNKIPSEAELKEKYLHFEKLLNIILNKTENTFKYDLITSKQYQNVFSQSLESARNILKTSHTGKSQKLIGDHGNVYATLIFDKHSKSLEDLKLLIPRIQFYPEGTKESAGAIESSATAITAARKIALRLSFDDNVKNTPEFKAILKELKERLEVVSNSISNNRKEALKILQLLATPVLREIKEIEKTL